MTLFLNYIWLNHGYKARFSMAYYGPLVRRESPVFKLKLKTKVIVFRVSTHLFLLFFTIILVISLLSHPRSDPGASCIKKNVIISFCFRSGFVLFSLDTYTILDV